MSRVLRIAAVYFLVAPMILLTAPAPALHASSASSQVIFSDSGTGSGTFVNPKTGSPQETHFGFWIWCEGESSSNPYHGQCNGAMYFYAFGITKGVTGTVTKIADNTFMMSVASSDGAVSCALTNTPPITGGLTNTVNVTCSAPSGSGSDSKAVVNVTGPTS